VLFPTARGSRLSPDSVADLLAKHVAPLDAADPFSARSRRARRQQSGRKGIEEGHHRKNSLFYKTENGAEVGDLFMSLIHACELNGVNAFDYITELLRHTEELKQNPSEWMPWNCRDTLARLTAAARVVGWLLPRPKRVDCGQTDRRVNCA
jgi:hypothetical protein